MKKSIAKGLSRWEQFNALFDDGIIRQLKPPVYGLTVMFLFRCANEGGGFKVSYSRLSQAIGISRRYATTILKDLIEWKVIRVHKRSVGRSTIYKFNFEPDEAGFPTIKHRIGQSTAKLSAKERAEFTKSIDENDDKISN